MILSSYSRESVKLTTFTVRSKLVEASDSELEIGSLEDEFIWSDKVSLSLYIALALFKV